MVITRAQRRNSDTEETSSQAEEVVQLTPTRNRTRSSSKKQRRLSSLPEDAVPDIVNSAANDVTSVPTGEEESADLPSHTPNSDKRNRRRKSSTTTDTEHFESETLVEQVASLPESPKPNQTESSATPSSSKKVKRKKKSSSEVFPQTETSVVKDSNESVAAVESSHSTTETSTTRALEAGEPLDISTKELKERGSHSKEALSTSVTPKTAKKDKKKRKASIAEAVGVETEAETPGRETLLHTSESMSATTPSTGKTRKRKGKTPSFDSQVNNLHVQNERTLTTAEADTPKSHEQVASNRQSEEAAGSEEPKNSDKRKKTRSQRRQDEAGDQVSSGTSTSESAQASSSKATKKVLQDSIPSHSAHLEHAKPVKIVFEDLDDEEENPKQDANEENQMIFEIEAPKKTVSIAETESELSEEHSTDDDEAPEEMTLEEGREKTSTVLKQMREAEKSIDQKRKERRRRQQEMFENQRREKVEKEASKVDLPASTEDEELPMELLEETEKAVADGLRKAAATGQRDQPQGEKTVFKFDSDSEDEPEASENHGAEYDADVVKKGLSRDHGVLQSVKDGLHLRVVKDTFRRPVNQSAMEFLQNRIHAVKRVTVGQSTRSRKPGPGLLNSRRR